MEKTTLHLHSEFAVGAVDPRLFGGFLEHLGRAVYQGVYAPESALADAHGFRSDVLSALRRLRMTVLRYPGGNFASGYHWLDGVGPRDQRPTLRDLAWQSREPNWFGTEECLALCRAMEWAPMLTVNLGSGTPEEARHWVEYCNSPAGTKYADLRAASGCQQPHGVKLWCLGNEMDGPWQIGHAPAGEYASRAQQAAKMMKDTDPTIELVACGSCGPDMPQFMEWDRVVLEALGDQVDYLSLHRYVGNPAADSEDYLAVTNSIDRQIEAMDAACRLVQAKRRSRKRVYLSLDEWNVWYKNQETNGAGLFAPHLLEEIYNLEDALAVGGFLHSLVRHADAVKIANLAQIVNVIAPLLTRDDMCLVQTTFHPFAMFAARRDGVSLRPVLRGPEYEGKTNGRVTFVDASAILNGDRLHVFLTNRSPVDPAPVTIRMADAEVSALETAEILTGPDAKAANTFDQPDVIAARSWREVSTRRGTADLVLPPLSLAATTWRISR